MNAESATQRRIVVWQVLAFLFLPSLTASVGLGTDRFWQCDPNVAGNWVVGNNWQGGLPGTGDNAYVDNGGAVTVSDGTAEARYLFLGYNHGGRIEQTGGQMLPQFLMLAVNAGSSGHYIMSAGYLRTELIEMGARGASTFTQSGGDIVLNGGAALVVGKGPGSPSWYSMEGGTILANGLYVGGTNGVGQFYQRAGVLTTKIEMLIGSGTGSQGYFELMAGARLGGQRIQVGSDGTGQFVQSGGDATFTGLITIGHSAGSLGSWTMKDGNFTTVGLNDIWVGYRSTGQFVQTGGHLSVGRDLFLGWDTSGSGTFVLSGGTVQTNYITVGRLGHGAMRVQGGGASISAGMYQQNAQSELISEVDPSGLSVIEVSGTAALSGTWTVVDAGAEYGRFDILRAHGGITGSFGAVQLPDSTWSWGIDGGTALWAQHVPEPASLSLLALGGLGVLRRKRPHRRCAPRTARPTAAAAIMVIAAAMTLLSGPTTGWATNTEFELCKLKASDPIEKAAFGRGVAINQDWAVIGASSGGTSSGNPGAAYFFKRNGATWTQTTKVAASDTVGRDYFGEAVSIYGDWAFVGAPRTDAGANSSGAVYVYQRTGDTWTQKQKLTDPAAGINVYYGSTVSLHGDYAVVGGDYRHVQVYQRNGDTWARIAELTPSSATTACFGHSVSVSDNYVIVGSWNNDPGQGYGTGAAYIFGRTGLTYSQVAKIVASDRQYGDNFGESVAITEDYAVVGAYKDDDRGTDSGSAYVFRRIGSSWVQSAKLLASNAANSDFFGKSVSIDGGTVVVGASNKRTDTGGGVGAAYWFELGSSWQEEEYLRPGSPVIGTGYAEYVGYSVSVDGPNAIVGGMFDCQGPSCSGAAYVFAVPEPATLFVMLAAGLPALLKRRRRVRS